MVDEQTANREALDARGAQSTQALSQDRQQLQGVADQYAAMAAGEGTSLAQEQLAASTDANVAATIAAMGSARGGNLNAAQTQAAASGAGLQQQGVQQMAQMRAMEQQNAMAAQAGIAGQLAGMSQGREASMLGMGQQGLQQQQMQTQEFQMKDAELREQRKKDRGERWMQGVGQVAGIAGTVAGAVASDIRAKKNIRKVGKGGLAETLATMGPMEHEEHDREEHGPSIAILLSEAGETMGDLDPFEYDYNERGRRAGGKRGRKAGIMAQDLAATELGEGMVYPNEDGTLTIDGPSAVSFVLAAGADHERRLRGLEGVTSDRRAKKKARSYA